MKTSTKKVFLALISMVGALLISTSIHAATGEVTRSGSTWTAKVNGSTVYSGSRMFDAITSACVSAGSNSTINIRNSGDSGNDGGNIYGIKPQSGQVLDFHNHTVNCNSSGDLAIAIYADRKSDITIKNIIVTGNPRYAFWFKGCNNMTFTNITMNLSNNSPVGLGIRVDASSASSSNLTINGSININGSAGHGIETYSVNGVEIGDVTVNNTGGCGVLLNNSTNCNVGVVTGNYNCPNAGYATFRVANSNGSTYCEGVYSRNSGRGFFSVSGSHDCTVGWVDISNTYAQGVFLEDATNTHVQSGTVTNGNPDVQLVRTTNCSVNVNNSDSSDDNNGSVNGTYAIIATHSGKALDTYAWGTTDGTNIVQWSFWGGDAQQFVIAPVDGIWHRITPLISSGQALDVAGCSTSNSANINTWSYWGGSCQQFRFQSAGSGKWRIINRNSEKCLDVAGNSSSDGANIVQYDCTSGANNQIFTLTNMKSATLEQEEAQTTEELSIYPIPANDNVTLNIPSEMTGAIVAIIYNKLGQQVKELSNLSVGENEISINDLASGVYFIALSNGEKVSKVKLIKE